MLELAANKVAVVVHCVSSSQADIGASVLVVGSLFSSGLFRNAGSGFRLVGNLGRVDWSNHFAVSKEPESRDCTVLKRQGGQGPSVRDGRW